MAESGAAPPPPEIGSLPAKVPLRAGALPTGTHQRETESAGGTLLLVLLLLAALSAHAALAATDATAAAVDGVWLFQGAARGTGSSGKNDAWNLQQPLITPQDSVFVFANVRAPLSLLTMSLPLLRLVGLAFQMRKPAHQSACESIVAADGAATDKCVAPICPLTFVHGNSCSSPPQLLDLLKLLLQEALLVL
ncbi:hypothetical protein ACSSS7_000072 [Eimeria intestinalis]